MAALSILGVSFPSSYISFIGEQCSVLANFTLNTEDIVTFEWENEKVATANLTKENGECIYRYLSLLFTFILYPN